MAELKDDEIQHLEEFVEGARSLWKRFAISKQLPTTIFTLFMYGYTNIKFSATPKEVWQDHQNPSMWRDF